MLYTMQADSMSRFFAMTITDNGAPWTAPDGAAYTVRFGAPGLPAGWYDTITEPGGGTHPAVVVDENTVTVEIAEQAVGAPGQNILCVLVTDAQGYQIASWPFVLSVQAVPGFDAPEATVYYNALTAQVAQVLASQTAAAASASAAAASETAAANSAAAASRSAQEAASAVTGVVSFKGRQGAVTPQAGDYTAEMVGAATEQQIPNYNMLDNTDFSNPINQRGVSGTISSLGYFIDRWKLVSGTVELTDDGLVLNGAIEQILENSIGTSFTASASAGTASYDNSSKTFTIVGAGETISWAKLEKGDVATPWQPKGYGAELAECQRYYLKVISWQLLGTGYVNWDGTFFAIMMPTPSTMRIDPTISNITGTAYFEDGKTSTYTGTPTAVTRPGWIAITFKGTFTGHGGKPVNFITNETATEISADL